MKDLKLQIEQASKKRDIIYQTRDDVKPLSKEYEILTERAKALTFKIGRLKQKLAIQSLTKRTLGAEIPFYSEDN